MKLTELLDGDLVFPKIACASRDELIQKLVDRVYASGRGLPYSPQDVLNTVYMREQIGGTLLPSGLSVPHARLQAFEGFIISLGIPAEPLFHERLQIRMMALMITSQSGGPHYLGALAAMTKISRNEEYFSRLCGAENPQDFFGILRERDQDID